MPKAGSAPCYSDLVEEASAILFDSSESPKIDSEVLLLHTVQQSLAWLISHGDKIATPGHIKQFYGLVEQRLQGQPIAYLLGYRDFWTLRLAVNEHVLIPRPDTESLVEQALNLLPAEAEHLVLDLGTGSGAIALALAKERPNSKIVAVDVSAAALDLAKKNAQSADLTNVDFHLGSWYQAIEKHCQYGKNGNTRFDLIASNPPYVEPEDTHLSQGDLRHEPDLALIGGGTDGLGDIREIVSNAAHYLNQGGYLILEHGYNQAPAVKELLHGAGFEKIELFVDLNNLPRCTSASLPS